MTPNTRGRSNPLIRAGWPGLKRLAGSLSFACRGTRPATTLAAPGGRTHRRLCCEPLEARELLAGSGLVEVGAQPEGALSGKIVYTHAGHGWTANNEGDGSWTTQRGEWYEIVEDLANQDQMTFLVDYLFRAGATVVPLRPVGHQTSEVILDNDDPGVTFVGAWIDSTADIYFGDEGDVPYRYAYESSTETAYARYRPNIPTKGFYPVYAWTRAGGNRLSDQLYRVKHTGGITEVTVDHRRVGSGPVYLGTYFFAAGTDGYVDISNRSDGSGSVVIADMIRFGNGMGDIDRGGGVSGQSREDEAGLYWVQWHVDHSQGIPESEYRTSSSDRSATVSLSPRYAEYMNREADGALSDRVFVSFHSNGGTGTARGVLGLYNGNNDPDTATPNQFLLANTLGLEVNDDLVAQAGQFEHDWYDRGSSVTLDRSDIEFGEINNLRINDEFDATIVETGYHDNELDTEMLRDPRVRDALARATYQGVVKYFNHPDIDGGTTPLIMLPGQVDGVRAVTTAAGSVTVSWSPPPANSYNGDAATGFRIYMSLDGYGFDGGTYVGGGGSTSQPFTGLDPAAGVHYFRVVAVNAGGESAPSEVVAALPNSASANILVVGGFDRFERRLNPREPYFSGTIDRVRPRQSNSFDYVVQVAEAVEAYAPGLTIDSASNETVIAGQVLLSNYDTVIWILGEESTADDTFNTTEQSLVSAFLSGGGNVFVSGAEIGWDLDAQEGGRAFYNNTLKADYVADDANTHNAVGVAGSIFAGLSITFDNGTYFYDTEYADVISPLGSATAALNYSGGTPGVAAIQYEATGSEGSLVMLGFPFETILGPITRATVMAAALDLFGTIVRGDMNGDGQVSDLDVAPFMDVLLHGPFHAAADMNEDGAVNGLDIGPFQAAVVGGGASASAAAAVSGVAEGAVEADLGVGARQSRTGTGTTAVWYVVPGVQRRSVAMVHPAIQTTGPTQARLSSDQRARTRERGRHTAPKVDPPADKAARSYRLTRAVQRSDTQRELAAVWAEDHDWLRDEVWSHRRH